MEYILFGIKRVGSSIIEDYEAPVNSIDGMRYIVLPDGTELYLYSNVIVTTKVVFELENLREEVSQLKAEQE